MLTGVFFTDFSRNQELHIKSLDLAPPCKILQKHLLFLESLFNKEYKNTQFVLFELKLLI